MILRLLGGLLLITACGRQVSINHTALEEASKLESGSTKTLQSGAISKMKQSGNAYLIIGSNSSYNISENSSYRSKEFIKKLPAGKTNVHFKGEFNEREKVIILREIFTE